MDCLDVNIYTQYANKDNHPFSKNNKHAINEFFFAYIERNGLNKVDLEILEKNLSIYQILEKFVRNIDNK